MPFRVHAEFAYDLPEENPRFGANFHDDARRFGEDLAQSAFYRDRDPYPDLRGAVPWARSSTGP